MTAERLDLTAMVNDIDLPCQARLHDTADAAAWVVWQVVCCPARREIGLICTPCLTRMLAGTYRVRCIDCDTVFARSRDRIVRFERINKPPTGTPPTGS